VKRIVASNRIHQGERHAYEGRIPEALQEFAEAQKMYPDTGSAESWNSLCWFASLYGYVSAVVEDACEKAVQLELDPSNWGIRDSRGLARALVGRGQEAIEDFRELAEKPPDRTLRARRQRWIEMLSKGEDPFSSPEEIEALKRE
jgi:tetratricopeptide (TPR) repeat protein